MSDYDEIRIKRFKDGVCVEKIMYERKVHDISIYCSNPMKKHDLRIITGIIEGFIKEFDE